MDATASERSCNQAIQVFLSQAAWICLGLSLLLVAFVVQIITAVGFISAKGPVGVHPAVAILLFFFPFFGWYFLVQGSGSEQEEMRWKMNMGCMFCSILISMVLFLFATSSDLANQPMTAGILLLVGPILVLVTMISFSITLLCAKYCSHEVSDSDEGKPLRNAHAIDKPHADTQIK
jgi:hypothetical protein